MKKQIMIRLEVEENESVEDISKIIENALNANNISYIPPILLVCDMSLEDLKARFEHSVVYQKGQEEGVYSERNRILQIIHYVDLTCFDPTGEIHDKLDEIREKVINGEN